MNSEVPSVFLVQSLASRAGASSDGASRSGVNPLPGEFVLCRLSIHFLRFAQEGRLRSKTEALRLRQLREEQKIQALLFGMTQKVVDGLTVLKAKMGRAAQDLCGVSCLATNGARHASREPRPPSSSSSRVLLRKSLQNHDTVSCNFSQKNSEGREEWFQSPHAFGTGQLYVYAASGDNDMRFYSAIPFGQPREISKNKARIVISEDQMIIKSDGVAGFKAMAVDQRVVNDSFATGALQMRDGSIQNVKCMILIPRGPIVVSQD